MKNLVAITLAVSLITSCRTQTQVSEEEHGSVEQASVHEPVESPAQETVIEVNSSGVRFDSLMKAPIEMPPVYYHDVTEASKESVEKFDKLSKASKGNLKIVVSAKVVAEELVNTLRDISTPGADLLIMIDNTFSMDDDIDDAKKGLDQIMSLIRRYRGTRLAVATYGDKNVDGASWFTFQNFETNYDSAARYIQGIKMTGGGDLPESVYDAFNKSCEQNFWKSNRKRNVILIGDAPPLEKPLSDFSIEDIISKTKEDKIKMNFYPIVIMPDMEEVKLSPTEIATYVPDRLATALYPNPSSGRIEVSLETSGDYHMEIYDITGKLVSGEDFFGLHYVKDLGSLPNGTYALRMIHSSHKHETLKFILER